MKANVFHKEIRRAAWPSSFLGKRFLSKCDKFLIRGPFHLPKERRGKGVSGGIFDLAYKEM